MSALWHGNKAEEPVGGQRKARAASIRVFFLLSPMVFYLGFPLLGRSRPEANQKWPNWKRMRAFAFIKPAFSLFGATAWAQVMYNSFTIIFPLTHPEWGVGDELWLMEMETKWPFNLFFFHNSTVSCWSAVCNRKLPEWRVVCGNIWTLVSGVHSAAVTKYCYSGALSKGQQMALLLWIHADDFNGIDCVFVISSYLHAPEFIFL